MSAVCVCVCVCVWVKTYWTWNPIQTQQHQYYKTLLCSTAHRSVSPFGFCSPQRLPFPWPKIPYPYILSDLCENSLHFGQDHGGLRFCSNSNCSLWLSARYVILSPTFLQPVVSVRDPGVWRVVWSSFAAVSNEASYQTDETVMDEMSLPLSPLCTLITLFHH